MGGVNWGRVIVGGLVAGVIINIGEALAGLLYMEDMKAALAAHDLTMSESPLWMALYIGLGFLYGILGVWIYAAIRPRYGAGARTAVIAAFALWLTYLGSIIGWASLGLYPQSLMLLWACVGLVEIVIGIWVGAKLYREPGLVSAHR